jgi:hypothetical protein
MEPVGDHRKMISLNARALVVYAERPVFPIMGRDERKERALDTVLPKQTLLLALFTAKSHKKEP